MLNNHRDEYQISTQKLTSGLMKPIASYLLTFAFLCAMSSVIPVEAKALQAPEQSSDTVKQVWADLHPQVTYRETEERTITATVNGETLVVADFEDNPYAADRFDIEQVGDWDRNGIQDLMYGAIHGGNDRPYTYVFTTYTPNLGLQSYPLVQSFITPTIEQKSIDGEEKIKWVITGIENNEGWHNRDFKQVQKRFIIEQGKPKLIEENVDEEIEALMEFRTRVLGDRGYDGVLFEFDLDKNGKPDQVVGDYWGRWGRMWVGVIWDDGRITPKVGTCKRIGVLATQTLGIHDLICDNSRKILWVGDRYESQPDRFEQR